MSSDPNLQWAAGPPMPPSYPGGQAREQIREPVGPAPGIQPGYPGQQYYQQSTQHAGQYGYPQAQMMSPWSGPQAGPPMHVAPKNPALAVVLSLFVPGLGTMVSGSSGRGLLILGVYIVGWVLSLVLIGIPILLGAWIWGMVDGYKSARRWNQQHGIIS